MQRVRDKPIPVRRRRWTRSPAMVACAVVVICVVGATIAGWIVAGSRDSVNVASNSGSQQPTEHVEKNHELAQEQENQPKVMEDLDPTGGAAPTTTHRDVPNAHQSKEQNGNAGSGEQRIGWDLDHSTRGGDDQIEDDRVGTQPGIAVSTQPGDAPGGTRDGSPSVVGAGEQRPVDSVKMGTTAEHHLGDTQLGETLPKRHPAEPADGLTGSTAGPSAKSSLSKSDAIRLAAKCIRDAEPNSNLNLDAKSAVARYYHKAKAYNGNSLWLVGFPETGRKGAENSDGESTQAVLYRIVWVQEDGSYSGNCQGELPPTKPPVLLGPDEEAKAIQIAKAFLRRHYPKLVGQRPPTATFNTDNRSFGGGPLWIVGFTFKEDPPPPSVQAVWVTPDGAVILGGVMRFGPGPAPKKEAPKSAAALWGPAVDGLQCRLHVEKTKLKAGQWPRLLVDVRNEGRREFSLGEAPDFWELECDGTWYRAGVWFSGDIRILKLTPSKTHHGFPLLFAKRWKWKAKDGGQPLVLGAGKHVLRVALQPAPKQGGQSPHVVSNPVEIEILPDHPTHAQQPAGKGESVPALEQPVDDAPDDESADLEIRIDEATTKSVTVTSGEKLIDTIRRCRPAQFYADDDPWIAYAAGDGGRYVLFFESAGDADDPRNDTLHLAVHYPKDDEPGEFLLPSNLRGKPCGEYMTLPVLTDSGEKWKAVSLALLMRVRDVKRLFEGAENLLEDRDKILYQAKGGGAFLLVFTPSKDAASRQRVLSDVIYRYGDPEETIHLFPRKRRGQKIPREYLELLDRAPGRESSTVVRPEGKAMEVEVGRSQSADN